MGSVKKEGTV